MIPTTFKGEELYTSQRLLGYAVTDTGVAVSRWRIGGGGGLCEEWHQIGTYEGQGGYRNIRVKLDGRRAYMGVHALVCWIFHGPKPEPGPEKIRWGALHKDGKPANNTPENLYWGDLDKDNTDDRERHGRTAKGDTCGRSKLNSDQVRTICQMVRDGLPRRTIAAQFKITTWAIWAILTRRTWRSLVTLPGLSP